MVQHLPLYRAEINAIKGVIHVYKPSVKNFMHADVPGSFQQAVWPAGAGSYL